MTTETTFNSDQPINGAQAPKLTDWANEPTAMRLQEDLEASRPAHDTFVQKVKHWNELNTVTGAAKPKKVKGRSEIQPKLIRRQAEWRYSALSEPFNSSEKLFDVKPVTFEDTKSARQNELVLNWQFRSKINRVHFLDNYVRACVDEGTAVVRTGWSRLTKEVEEDAPTWEYRRPNTAEEIEALEMAEQLRQTNPNEYAKLDPALVAACQFFQETGEANVAVQIGTEKVKVKKVIENRPTVDLINLENLYFDPSCGGDIEKAGFVVFSFETSQAELRKQPKRYKNLKYVDWEGASAILEPNHAPQSTDINFNYKDPLRKRVVAFEYWGNYDIHGNGELVPIVATWIGSVLIRLEENPFPDKAHPFILVPYMPVKRQALGEPDAELLEDNQKVLGAVTRGMIDLLGRSANGQQGFAKGMLDVLNKRRFESGQDYEFNPNLPPQQGHMEHKYPEIPQSAIVVMQMQNQEAEALTGVKAFSGGLSGEAFGDVAAGIKGILDAASKREMAILRRLAAGLVAIGKKFIAMNAEFLSEEEIIRVTNEEFVTVRRDELPSVAGSFDMKVDISTAEIDSNKSQDLAFMLQTVGPNLGFEFVQMILIEIARLKRMPELEKMIRDYKPQPDPLEQRLKEAEIKKAEKEVEKLQSEINLNNAKAQREMVGAEQDALDALEQETGTKHAREMQKQVAQSEGNQSLEITKALLKPIKPEESKPNVEAAVGFNELSKLGRDPLRN
jgi:hypothetical protein